VKLLPAKAPATPPALTLGACREQLKANGYFAFSASLPGGYLQFYGDKPWHRPIPQCLTDGHPVAVDCTQLVLLVVSTADTDFREKIDAVLRRHKLVGGPVRVGSDGTRLHVLRASGIISTCSALGDALTFLGMSRGGPFNQALTYELLPLDGHWEGGTLLDTPIADLPEISDDLVTTVRRDLVEATAPPPAPPVKTRRGWLGG
jgi:hypothetical protein